MRQPEDRFSNSFGGDCVRMRLWSISWLALSQTKTRAIAKMWKAWPFSR